MFFSEELRGQAQDGNVPRNNGNEEQGLRASQADQAQKPKLQRSTCHFTSTPTYHFSSTPECKKLFEMSLRLRSTRTTHALVDHDLLCSDETSYLLKSSSGGSDSRNVKRIKDDRHKTRSTNNPTAQTASLRASKDALGHAAEIVILNSTDKGCAPMTTTDSPDDFYPNTTTSAHHSIFKALYELGRDYSDSEMGSIERTNDETDVFFPMKSGDGDNPLEDCSNARTQSNLHDDPKWSSFEFARLSDAVCKYTVENLHSCNPKSNVPRRRSAPATHGQLRVSAPCPWGKCRYGQGTCRTTPWRIYT